MANGRVPGLAAHERGLLACWVVPAASFVTYLSSAPHCASQILCATASWDVAASVDAVPLPKELIYERVPAAVAAKAQVARPLAGKPVVGAVADCTSAGSLAQNFVVTTNSSDTVAVGDYVGLTFDFDLEQEVRAARIAAGVSRLSGSSLRALTPSRPPLWPPRTPDHGRHCVLQRDGERLPPVQHGR